MDYNKFFSEDCFNFMESPVREIFKKVDLSQIYSFAGGYPSADTFPLEDINRLCTDVIKKYGAKAFQYGGTQGVPELRQALSNRYNVDVDNIQITTSSQQGIDVCTRILINPNDVILCLNPTYLGAIQSFKSYRADIQGIEHSDDLFVFEENITSKLIEVKEAGKKVKFFYLIPDFQNPTGESLTLRERELIIKLSNKYDFLIVEDSPYKELRYSGEDVPSMYSLDSQRVIFLGSFSKIFAPGFRLGWIFANKDILHKIYVCKQSLDLCPPIFDQYLTYEFISSGLLDKNLEKTKKLYSYKRDLMLQCLNSNLTSHISWTKPDGGLFLFLTFPKWFNAVNFYDKALSNKLAYVAGNFFSTDDSHYNTMRLNFSFMSEDKIKDGIALLGRLIMEEYRNELV